MYDLSSFEPIGLSRWLFTITILLVAVLLLLSQDGSTSRSSHHALVELGEAEDVVGGLISESRCKTLYAAVHILSRKRRANVSSGWPQSRQAGVEIHLSRRG